MNGPCFVTGQHVIDLFVEVKRHINPCGSFYVVSQRNGEERYEIVEEMKEMDRGERKLNEIEETEEIKTPPSTFTCCKDSRPCPTVRKLHDTFASPNHPTGQRVYSVFGTLSENSCWILKYMYFFFFFFFFFFYNSAKVLIQQ